MVNRNHHYADLFRLPTSWWSSLKQGVRNLINWFPIIWKDRDWDYDFLYKMIIKKLYNMADYHMTQGVHVNAQREAERMETCARLLILVSDCHYEMEPNSFYQQDFHIDKDGLLIWDDVAWDNLSEYFDLYPRVYKQAVKEYPYLAEKQDRIGIATYMGIINHERARTLAFKMLDTYSPGWWD